MSTTTGGAAHDEPRWLSEDEQRLWRAHVEITRLLYRQLERDLQPFGLTMTDYEILVNLSEAPERRLRMSELASVTLLSKSRLSHQITRLEAAGMARREDCASDRRGLFAVLTDQGWETMRKVAPHHVASVRRHFVDLLPEEDVPAVGDALTAIAAHLRAQR